MATYPTNPYANFQMPGLLGQGGYVNPMQAGFGGAAQAIAPMMGYTDRPTSIGQVLAAAGGGGMQGMQQAVGQNQQTQLGHMNMQMVKQKMADMDTARASALRATQKSNFDATAAWKQWDNLSDGMKKYIPEPWNPSTSPAPVALSNNSASGTVSNDQSVFDSMQTPGTDATDGPGYERQGGVEQSKVKHEFDLMPIMEVQALAGHENKLIASMATEYLKNKAKSVYDVVQNPYGRGGVAMQDQYGQISGYQGQQEKFGEPRQNPNTGAWEQQNLTTGRWQGMPKPSSSMSITSDGQGGFSFTQGAGGNGTDDKPFNRGLKKDIMSAQTTLDQIGYTQSLYEPEFLTYMGEGKAAYQTILNKMDPTNRDQYTARRAAFISQTNQAFIAYRKWATGVAGGEKEMAEIKRSTFSEDDSPQDYEAKIAGMQQMTRKLMVRNAMALKNGIQVGSNEWKSFIQGVPLDGIPTTQERGDTLAGMGYSADQILTILGQEGYK